MRKSWLIAAVVGGAASAAQAADVQLFGIHVPQTNRWAVYATISNPASATPTAGMENVAGISSIAVDVLNNSGGTVATAVNTLPVGDTNDATALEPKYGFWVFRPTTVDITAEGARDIRAGQFAEFAPGSGAQYNPLVLQGVGLRSGSRATGGVITSPTDWSHPVQVATGTYTGTPTAGLTLRYTDGTGVNLLRDTDPSATVNWSGPGNLEGAVSATVVNARTFTSGTLTPGTTTTKAGQGDANLDLVVDFNDLAALAQNYNQTNERKTWFQGDFTLDGIVDFNDLAALAQNYNQPVAGAALGGSFGGDFGADVERAFAQVPEPGTIGLLGIAAVGLAARRRRK
jgi:hypothetical protein